MLPTDPHKLTQIIPQVRTSHRWMFISSSLVMFLHLWNTTMMRYMPHLSILFPSDENRRRSIDAVTQSYLYRVVHASSRHISSIKSVGMGNAYNKLELYTMFHNHVSKVYNLSNAFQWFFSSLFQVLHFDQNFRQAFQLCNVRSTGWTVEFLSPKEFQNAVLDCLRFSSIDERMDADGEESEE